MERKVAIYARVSTEHEAQLSALDNQIQYYDEILKHHTDWILYDRYIDEGITGTSVKKRKNFMRMIQDAENGCFDLIITREVSRFARNTVDTLQETRKLKKIGVEVYFTEDNIWTFNDEDGELKLTIMATLAQNESKKTSQRVKAGQKISFQNGVFYGTGNILGYDKVGKEFIVNEEQAKTVKLIYSLYMQGDGASRIASELEKRGYLTSTGLSKWNASTIIRILKNPFYCGTIVYRKSYIPDFLEQKAKSNHGEVEQVVVEGRHQPLVSKEVFEQVQRILETKTLVTSENKRMCKNDAKSVWSKKLICECGSTFTRQVYNVYEDGKTYYYQCYNQRNYGSYKSRIKKGLSTEGACNSQCVQEWKLDVMANLIFNYMWKDKEKILNIIEELLDEVISKKENKDSGILDNELQNIEKKISVYKTKLNNLLEIYLNGYATEEQYKNKKAEIEKNIADLEEMKNISMSKYGNSKETVKERVNSLKKSIKRHLDREEDHTISEELIDKYIEKIVVYKEKFDLKLKYFDDEISIKINKLTERTGGFEAFWKEDNLHCDCCNGTGRNQRRSRKINS